MSKQINVINFRGEKEKFSEQKVYESARRVGASEQIAEEITETIKDEVYDGIQTSEIFNRIKELLDEKSPKLSMKFSLKEGMRKLGPTGYPFEKFIGEIFHRLGYNTELNLYLAGKCLDKYETDFLAEKDQVIKVGECKFRNKPEDSVIELDTVLAFQAQMQDLRNGNLFDKERFKNKEVKPILVTNTKFSGVATDYAECVGIELLGWRTPNDQGLETIIDENGFYPITILPSLKQEDAPEFIKNKMALVQNLLELDKEEFLRQNEITKNQLEKLVEEAKALLN